MSIRLRGMGGPLLLGLAACGSGSSGNGAKLADSDCGDPIETRSLAWSERSPLGFSADELLGALGTEFRGRLTYDDGSTTSLTLGLARASGSVAFESWRTSSAAGGASAAAGAANDDACPDGLTLPATVSLATSDGAFAEAWPVSLIGRGAMSAIGQATPLALDALMGNYMPAGVDPARYDTLRAQLSIRFAGAEWSGSLSVVPATGSTQPVDGATF
ncbi:MAG TPA: hypothetical protein VMG12_06860 [Polyangiaceae bacterium]|nr:hypothetical protein [Polyangiaceae bacterium]